MQLGCATVLLLIGVLAASAAAERQVFCYSRVGGTRKYMETQQVDESCEGPLCAKQDTKQYKTELVFRTVRHCCAGYQRHPNTPDICLPVCSRGCPQGESCTAPNRCECAEGHERNSEGHCVAVPAPLSGDEPTTLQSQVLSFVSSLLDGVKALGWMESDDERILPAISTLPRHKENQITRTTAEKYSEEAGASCPERHISSQIAQSNPSSVPRRSTGAGVDGSSHKSRWLSSGVLEHRWNNSHANCSSDVRPLVVPLALTAPLLSTAQFR